MTSEMRNLLLLLGAIIIVLLLVMILFGGKSPFMKIFGFFFEDTGEGGRRNKEDVQKSSFEPIVEMAKLVRKSDDRLRVYESDGSVKLIDAYYELEFITRKGKKLKIECSKEAYEKVPFNEEGSLTYKRNTLVKFKFYEGTIFNSTEQK